jgi:hypothetical protein
VFADLLRRHEPRRVWSAVGITALAVAVLAALIVVPLVRAATGTHGETVTVVGGETVRQASDELARRLRQQGYAPVIIAVDSCADVPAGLEGTVVVVVEADTWYDTAVSTCASLSGDDDRTVASPLVSDGSSEPMFGADRMPCVWFDTPGAGEDRPGLGQCESDGFVTIIDDGLLTPAGRERFARRVVESLR